MFKLIIGHTLARASSSFLFQWTNVCPLSHYTIKNQILNDLKFIFNFKYLLKNYTIVLFSPGVKPLAILYNWTWQLNGAFKNGFKYIKSHYKHVLQHSLGDHCWHLFTRSYQRNTCTCSSIVLNLLDCGWLNQQVGSLKKQDAHYKVSTTAKKQSN